MRRLRLHDRHHQALEWSPRTRRVEKLTSGRSVPAHPVRQRSRSRQPRDRRVRHVRAFNGLDIHRSFPTLWTQRVRNRSRRPSTAPASLSGPHPRPSFHRPIRRTHGRTGRDDSGSDGDLVRSRTDLDVVPPLKLVVVELPESIFSLPEKSSMASFEAPPPRGDHSRRGRNARGGARLFRRQVCCRKSPRFIRR
jgi:hypothetical protein